jgi:hypothetical protein
MFNNVKKVDERGVVIKSYKKWRANNPNKLSFDSKLEWEIWVLLKKEKINFTIQPNVVLIDAVKTHELVKTKIKFITQRPITYTPDYYLTDYNIYIEVKGWPTPAFRLRWKLFKVKGYCGFIVSSKNDMQTLLNYFHYGNKNSKQTFDCTQVDKDAES